MAYFRILGPLTVERQESGAVALNAQMVRRLLGALLSRANDLVSTEDLVSALWGDDAPPSARKTLQVYVRRLRSVLGDDTPIIHEPAGYRIKVCDDELDSLRFTRLVASAAREGRTERAADLMREALELWHGAAFEDVREHPPLTDEAHRLDEERLRVEAEHVSLRLDLGQHAELVPHLHKLTETHPYREDLRGHLMLALYRSGRQSEALETFRGTRRLLADELGVEPGPELQRLHEAILRGDPSLRVPGGAQVPRELPADVGGFVGRAEQIQALDEMLPGASPVVISAIAGTAGVGKTALAVHWARRVADRFPDGQLYLNLNGFSSTAPVQPIEALASMLRSIGVTAEKVPVEEAEAAALFRTQMSGRRMLVMLDNARTADQVRPLLPGGSGSLVLITSRSKLSGLVAREGARRLSLDVLTPEEAEALLSQMLGSQRVAAEPVSVAALARACAYLPLALRIAAANLNDSPGRSIATHVEALLDGNRLASLEVEDDDQAAVRATFDLSYLDLPEDIRRTFRLLGLIPGPDFTVEAVAALAGLPLPDTQRNLTHLANAYLIDQMTPDRFTFHDLLRLYARERALAEESPERCRTAATRLYNWYVASVEAAADILYPNLIRLEAPAFTKVDFNEAGVALVWLDAERLNLLAAIHDSPSGVSPEARWLLVSGLRGYLTRRRHLGELLSAAHAALEAAMATNNRRAEAISCLAIAHAYQVRSSFQRSLEYLRKAGKLAGDCGWPELEATCLGNLGGLHFEAGDMEKAEYLVRQSLELARKIGRYTSIAAASSNLGVIASKAGRLAEAESDLRRAVEISHRMGLIQVESGTQSDLGEVLRYLGRIDEAAVTLEQAVALKRIIGDRLGEALAWAEMVYVRLQMGELEMAQRAAETALEIGRDVGSVSTEATALMAAGYVCMGMADATRALTHYKQAEAMLDGTAGTPYLKAVAGVGVASAHLQLDHLNDALQSARRALTIVGHGRFRILEGETSTLFAKIMLKKGDREAANTSAYSALESHRETGYRLGEAEALLILADLESGDQGSRYRQIAAEIYDFVRNHGYRSSAKI